MPPFGFKWAEVNLNRELRAILAQCIKLKACPHRPHARIAEKLIAEIRMPGPEALRNQHLNRLAQQLRSRVSKLPFYLRIDKDDLSFSIHNHYGVRRSFQ